MSFINNQRNIVFFTYGTYRFTFKCKQQPWYYWYRYPFYHYNYSSDNIASKSFIKTYLWGTSNTASGGTSHWIGGYYWDAVYFYAPYIYDSINSTNSYEPNIKNFAEGALGINILTDKAWLVHTLYCSVDLGEKQTWLNRGIEAKVESGTGNYTYTLPDNIPSGKYYTTIIHFADGDFCMTPVKYKN